jgi:hypothetical protein
MKRVILPNKYVAEAMPVFFDFTSQLSQGDAISGTPTVTCTPYMGTDGAAAGMPVGATVVSGNIVRQKLQQGVAGVTYTVTCTAATTIGHTLIQQGFLTVLPSQP